MPPEGVTLILPPAVHVAAVFCVAPFTPIPTFIKGNVPHLGFMVEALASKTAQVSLLFADVHAKYRSEIVNDSPQLTAIVVVPDVAGRKLSEFFMIGPAHAKIAVPVPISTPLELYLCNVPHKAKDVLVEPVLFLIPNTNVLLPVQLHRSLAGGGKVALINSKSPDVHEVAGGNVCANV
jgi:hypothetical protein